LRPKTREGTLADHCAARPAGLIFLQKELIFKITASQHPAERFTVGVKERKISL